MLDRQRRDRDTRRPDRSPPQGGPTIRVLHEDADVIIVLKPAWMEVGFSDRDTPPARGTLLDRLRKGHRVPMPITRLGGETSGVVLMAKTPPARRTLVDMARSGRIRRLYDAVVEGSPVEQGDTRTIQSHLETDEAGRARGLKPHAFSGRPRQGAHRDQPVGHDRPAVTHVRASHAGESRALVQIKPETNRRNQLRAHMAEIGHPIVGDREYGAGDDPIGRVALHLRELVFAHPRTNKPVRVSSPAPASFHRLVGATPPADAPEETIEPPRREGAGWDHVADWYDDLIGTRRNDHYENVILPGIDRLLPDVEGRRVLDVACGQGVVCRRLGARGAIVTGIDASERLIEAARGHADSERIMYSVGDVRDLPASVDGPFDDASCVMAITNIEPMAPVFSGVSHRLVAGGRFVLVLSHPAFRLIGRSSWGWDQARLQQYRRIDGYLTRDRRQIKMHPGSAPEVTTWTFHRPLQEYVAALAGAGFSIDAIEEWTAQRHSDSGPRADEENRTRAEIPLFMAIRAIRGAGEAGVAGEPDGDQPGEHSK